jgi:universal stress protein E
MRILCATDLLPKSEAAVERAGMMARRPGARLGIVHVLSSERDARQARSALAQMEKRFRATLGNEGIAPSVILRCGKLASQLTRVVQRIAPDLLVLGSRRRGSMCDRLGQTLAEGISSAHRCPLLIVKQRVGGDYRNILLALDFSPAAEEIIRTAQSIVLHSGVNTSVVHAFEPDYGMLPYIPKAIQSVGAAHSPERAEAERALRRLLKDHSERLADCNLILSSAFPLEAIVNSVKRVQSDLLVMGTRGYGRLRRLLLGSIVRPVLDEVPCDILLVPWRASQHSRERPLRLLQDGAPQRTHSPRSRRSGSSNLPRALATARPRVRHVPDVHQPRRPRARLSQIKP